MSARKFELVLGQLVKAAINGAYFSKGEVFKVISIIGDPPECCRFVRCERPAAPLQQPLYFRPEELEPFNGSE